jgi:hypothetical protein
MATLHLPTPVTTEKLISSALWTAQVVLASIFAVDGIINLTTPIDRLIEITTWAASIPTALVRVFGAAEIIGAVTLMLPTSSRVLTRIAGASAAIFAVLVLADTSARMASTSARALVLELMLFVVTGLVAWERLRAHREGP